MSCRPAARPATQIPGLEIPSLEMPAAEMPDVGTIAIRELIDPAAARSAIDTFIQNCGAVALGRRFFLPRELGPAEALSVYRDYLLPRRPHQVALMAFSEAKPVGLLNVLSTGPRAAEAAVVVAEDWQHRGVGRALALAALRDGRWADWTVRVHVQHANTPGRRLLQGIPAPRLTVTSGPAEAEIALRVPDPTGPALMAAP